MGGDYMLDGMKLSRRDFVAGLGLTVFARSARAA